MQANGWINFAQQPARGAHAFGGGCDRDGDRDGDRGCACGPGARVGEVPAPREGGGHGVHAVGLRREGQGDLREGESGGHGRCGDGEAQGPAELFARARLRLLPHPHAASHCQGPRVRPGRIGLSSRNI